MTRKRRRFTGISRSGWRSRRCGSATPWSERPLRVHYVVHQQDRCLPDSTTVVDGDDRLGPTSVS